MHIVGLLQKNEQHLSSPWKSICDKIITTFWLTEYATGNAEMFSQVNHMC